MVSPQVVFTLLNFLKAMNIARVPLFGVLVFVLGLESLHTRTRLHIWGFFVFDFYPVIHMFIVALNASNMSWLITPTMTALPQSIAIATPDDDNITDSSSSSSVFYEHCDYEWPSPGIKVVLCFFYSVIGLIGR